MTQMGLNTASDDRPTPDGGQFDHRDHSAKVVWIRAVWLIDLAVAV